MKKLIAPIFVALFAVTSFAADTPQPETPGSKAAQGAAESKHLAKPHGTTGAAKQPEAQKSGNAKAQAAAEKQHLKKPHGKVNDSADKRLEKDHPNH